MPDDVDFDRSPVELSIDAWLAAEADAAGIDLAAILEHALAAKLDNLRAGHKPADLREAIACINTYIEENGLPMAKLREPA